MAFRSYRTDPSLVATRNTGWFVLLVVVLGIVILPLALDCLAEISVPGAVEPSGGMGELIGLVRCVAAFGLFVLLSGGAVCVLRGVRLMQVVEVRASRWRSHANGLIASDTFSLSPATAGFVVGRS